MVEKVQSGQIAQHFSQEVVVHKQADLDYLLFLPAKYERQDQWPLILFLHGAGERGDDIEKIKVHGLPKVVQRDANFPFIVVSPQCPSWEAWDSDTLAALLAKIMKEYKVDPSRVYLTGLSMGGFGTWRLACAHPELFAAIAPICGGGEPKDAPKLKDIPVWAFHGAKDPTVPPEQTKRMVSAVNAAGGHAKLTIYPEAEHDSWTATYDNPELYRWFLSHKK